MPPTDEEFESLLSLGIPITTIGFIHEGCPSVAIDDVMGGRVATKHLTDLGHREIAVISGQRETAYNFDVSDNRTKGFLEVLNEVGAEWNPEFEIRGDFNIYTAEIAMEAFLQRKKLPTALFCQQMSVRPRPGIARAQDDSVAKVPVAAVNCVTIRP